VKFRIQFDMIVFSHNTPRPQYMTGCQSIKLNWRQYWSQK